MNPVESLSCCAIAGQQTPKEKSSARAVWGRTFIGRKIGVPLGFTPPETMRFVILFGCPSGGAGNEKSGAKTPAFSQRCSNGNQRTTCTCTAAVPVSIFKRTRSCSQCLRLPGWPTKSPKGKPIKHQFCCTSSVLEILSRSWWNTSPSKCWSIAFQWSVTLPCSKNKRTERSTSL